jgi:hypothetical protein
MGRDEFNAHTQKVPESKGFRDFPVLPLLRRLDLNQRPLGYERLGVEIPVDSAIFPDQMTFADLSDSQWPGVTPGYPAVRAES